MAHAFNGERRQATTLADQQAKKTAHDGQFFKCAIAALAHQRPSSNVTSRVIDRVLSPGATWVSISALAERIEARLEGPRNARNLRSSGGTADQRRKPEH